MIDFRYHLVSLIAVFLAVALGIVIGTSALNGPLTDNLQGQVTALQEDKRALEDQTQGLQAQLDESGGFDEAVAPALVGGLLTDRDVLLVLADADVTPDQVEDLTSLLGTAGATVTGTITLTESYADPESVSGLESYLTGQGLPTEVVRPETSDTGELVASVLAQVLMVPAGGIGEPPAPTSATTVLSALSGLDVLTYDTAPADPADLAVVLTSGGLTAEDPEAEGAALLQLVTALDARGSGAVLAGDPVAAGDGLVGAARTDPAVTEDVSTIDNLDTAAGRISVVLALANEVQGVPAGRYGTGEGTEPAPPVSR